MTTDTATRHFHLGDILSITTERLVSPTRMDGVYAILNFMTGDNLFTHQLPRAARECQPWLLRQHPQLAGITTDDLAASLAGDPPKEDSERIVADWLAGKVAEFDETLPVGPIPAAAHERIDPIEEAERMVPGRVVVVRPEDRP